MKKPFYILAPALLAGSPALAADNAAGASVMAVAPAATIAFKDGRPPNWRRINHKINKRAKNAVKNGANPARVRKKAKAYKKKIYRRWKASR